MNIKLIAAATAVLVLSACSQEKVCEMGTKAFKQNAEHIAKAEADLKANPSDTTRNLVEKMKAQQVKLSEQLKTANCKEIDPGKAAAATTATSAATPPVVADAAVKELGRATFKSTDGKEVTAVYTSDEIVTLNLPDGTTQKLKQAVSGSGIRFIEGDREWIEHQGQGMYSVGGNKIFDGGKIAK